MSPPVDGRHISNKNNHRYRKYALGLAGLFIGGVITASGITVAGGLVRPIGFASALAILWVLLLMSILVDAGILELPLPETKYLIPASRFERSLALGIFTFSVELGLGFRTRISYAAPYVVATYVLLLSSGVGSIVMVVGWALGRSALMAVYLPRSRWLNRGVPLTEDEVRNQRLLLVERVGAFTGHCGCILAPLSMMLILLQSSYEWIGA